MNVKKIKETAKYMLRSYPVIKRYVNEVEGMYAMTPEELNSRNEKRFVELFRKAWNESPFYHKLYTEAGIGIDDVKCLADIKKLPVITKAMIREHIDDMLLIQKRLTVKNHTSGTTGNPLWVYEDWPSIWREQAYFYCYRKRCGYDYRKDVIASLRGHLDRKTDSMYVGVSKTLYLSSYNLSDQIVEKYHSLLLEYKPKAIEGYPSSLFSLAKMLEKVGYNDIRIPVAFTSSETLDVNMRRFIERILHTQIYDHYGNTERTIRLEEAIGHDGYYEDPGYSINEYEDGYVVTTSLINMSFPMIRYKVDDSIQLKSNVNIKNVTDATVLGISGRSADCIVGKDGTRFNGAALTYFAKAIPNIQVVQLIQQKVGAMEVCIVPENCFSEADKLEIRNVVDNILGLDNIDYSVKIITTEELRVANNGKMSLIVSDF